MTRKRAAGIRQFVLESLKIFLAGGVILTLVWGSLPALVQHGIFVKAFFLNGMATVLLWQGNAYLSDFPDRWANWLDAPVKRLTLTFLVTMAYTSFIWVFIAWLYDFDDYGWDFAGFLKGLNIYVFLPTLAITFVITTFMHGRGFLMGLKNSITEAERLKKQQLEAQYEALKNQINPHFLFNSLNVLAALVHKDPNESERFIHRLASVLRYILESREKETVNLEEELRMLDAYLSMMKIRFSEGFRYEIDIPEPAQYEIAPLCLQMLVENAFKHNEVSRLHPLSVEVFMEDQAYLTVRNSLQKKEQIQHSSGIGLANIKARYEFLSEKTIKMEQSGTHFSVSVPLIPVSKSVQS